MNWKNTSVTWTFYANTIWMDEKHYGLEQNMHIYIYVFIFEWAKPSLIFKQETNVFYA